MTYSANLTIENELKDLSTLSTATRAYFRQRNRDRLHDLVLRKFKEAQTGHGLTKAELARRMGRKPELVTRWLQSPGNWRSDTLSDMLLGIAGEEIEAFSVSPLMRPKRNYEPKARDDLGTQLSRLQSDESFAANEPSSKLNKMLEAL